MNDQLIKIALSQYGIAEFPGDEHNPEILKWFHETGHTWVSEDETPSCSAFVNWCAMKAGLDAGTSLVARDGLKVGIPIKREDLILGDVVFFWRESIDSWKGHKAFFIRDAGKNLWVFGANQSNRTQISAYRQERVLGYRRLRKITTADRGFHQTF